MKFILTAIILSVAFGTGSINAAIRLEKFECESMHHEGQAFPRPIPDFPNYSVECYVRAGGVLLGDQDPGMSHNGISCTVVVTSLFPAGHVSNVPLEIVSEKRTNVYFKAHNLNAKYHKRTKNTEPNVELEIPSLKLEASCEPMNK